MSQISLKFAKQLQKSHVHSLAEILYVSVKKQN